MAATLNKVLLIGNLTRDPELRYVPSGSAVVNFSIAVNRVYTTQAGERKEDVCFVRIVAWSRLAEICGEYLSKGSSVFIEGRLQSRTWETDEGQKRTTFEVVADNIQFLPKNRAANTENFDGGTGDSGTDTIEEKPAVEETGSEEVSEEEVPF